MLRFTGFCLITAILALSQCLLAAPEDVDRLLDGVDETTAPGCLLGPVCVFGDDAFVVMTAQAGRSRLPMIGAARFGEGRVIVGGHEGAFSALSDRPDNMRLMQNSIAWLSQEADAPSVALCGWGGIAAPLQEAEFSVTQIGPADLGTGLSDYDVLIVGLGDLGGPTDVERQDGVREFVQNGGGLLTAVCPWGWMQVTGKDLRVDLGGNIMLHEMGLMVADGMLGGTGANGYLADLVALDLTHAGRAVDLLEAHVDGESLLSAEDLAQVSETLANATRALPADDAAFAPRFATLCDRPEAACVPTEAEPVGSDRPLARIAATLYANSLSGLRAEDTEAHPSADSFPGAVPADAERVQQVVIIDTAVPDWHSIGLYAAPGEVVTVTIPTAAAGQGLEVRIGCHSDGLWHLDKWQRFPAITNQVALAETTTTIASPFGGLVYIVVPGNCQLGAIEATVEGAVRAPLYVQGETSHEDWINTIRAYPGPWAEVGSDKLVISVPSEVVRTLDNPEQLMTFWDEVMDACAHLAAIPSERARPERYVADVQISAGYMHSGYPIMTWLDVKELVVDYDRLLTTATWGHFHEMGHNHQSGNWTFGGTGEVTCNLFSLYCHEMVCELPEGKGHPAVNYDAMQERFAQYLADGASFEKWCSDPFLALHMYVQLQQAFGWDAFIHVFAEYEAAPQGELPQNDDEKRDQWMVRLSREVGRNLGPFFDGWGVPVTAEAKQSISDLPEWMPEDWPV